MAGKMVAVNITLGPVAARSVASTLAQLKRIGLREVTLLDAVGVVTGRVDAERIAELARVPGVTVELDETVSIPPPDAPVQ